MEQPALGDYLQAGVGMKRVCMHSSDIDTVYPPKKRALFDYNREQALKIDKNDNLKAEVDENSNRHAFYNTKLKLDRFDNQTGIRPRSDSLHSSNSQYSEVSNSQCSETSSLSSASRETSPVTINGVYDHETPERNSLLLFNGQNVEVQKPLFTADPNFTDILKPVISKSLFPLNSADTLKFETVGVKPGEDFIYERNSNNYIDSDKNKGNESVKIGSDSSEQLQTIQSDIPHSSSPPFQQVNIPFVENSTERQDFEVNKKPHNHDYAKTVNCQFQELVSDIQEPIHNSQPITEAEETANVDINDKQAFHNFTGNMSSSKHVNSKGIIRTQRDDFGGVLSDVTNCLKPKKKSAERNSNVQEIYKCSVCNKEFRQSGNFHSHMQLHMETNRICKCGVCDLDFDNSDALQDHMRSQHTGAHPYKCEHCSREFSQFNNLRRHLRVHREKTFKCNLCDRLFNEEFYLKMHMGTHTGQRVYSCGVCNACFTSSHELKSHVITHSPSELHVCNICGKAFSKACVLRQHKKAHSGDRPHKCTSCPKTFIHRHHLTMHMRSHADNKPYTCDLCNKVFSQTSHLYKHLRQHEEDNSENNPNACNGDKRQSDGIKKKKNSNIGKTKENNASHSNTQENEALNTIHLGLSSENSKRDLSQTHGSKGINKLTASDNETVNPDSEKLIKRTLSFASDGVQKTRKKKPKMSTAPTGSSGCAPQVPPHSLPPMTPSLSANSQSLTSSSKLPPFTSISNHFKDSQLGWSHPSSVPIPGYQFPRLDQTYQPYGHIGYPQLQYDPMYLAYSAQMQAYYNMMYYNARSSSESQYRNEESDGLCDGANKEYDESNGSNILNNITEQNHEELIDVVKDNAGTSVREVGPREFASMPGNVNQQGSNNVTEKNSFVTVIRENNLTFLGNQQKCDELRQSGNPDNLEEKIPALDQGLHSSENILSPDDAVTEPSKMQLPLERQTKDVNFSKSHHVSSPHEHLPAVDSTLGMSEHIRKVFNLQDRYITENQGTGFNNPKDSPDTSEESSHENSDSLTPAKADVFTFHDDKKLGTDIPNNQHSELKTNTNEHESNNNGLTVTENDAINTIQVGYEGTQNKIMADEVLPKLKQMVEVKLSTDSYENDKLSGTLYQNSLEIKTVSSESIASFNNNANDFRYEDELEVKTLEIEMDEDRPSGKKSTSSQESEAESLSSGDDKQEPDSEEIRHKESINPDVDQQRELIVTCDTCRAVFSCKTDLKTHFMASSKCFSKVCDTSKISEELGWRLLDYYLSSLEVKRAIKENSEEAKIVEKIKDSKINENFLDHKTNTMSQNKHITVLREESNRIKGQLDGISNVDCKKSTEISRKDDLKIAKNENNQVLPSMSEFKARRNVEHTAEIKADMERQDRLASDKNSTKSNARSNFEYKCQFCGVSIYDEKLIKEHIMTHSSDRPYLCTVCNRNFTHKHNLKRHMMSHSDKSVECSVCGRRFKETFYLQMHMKVHADENHQICEICGELVPKSDMSVHVNSHIKPIEANPTYAQIADRVKEIINENVEVLDLSKKKVSKESLMKMNVEQLKEFMMMEKLEESSELNFDKSQKNSTHVSEKNFVSDRKSTKETVNDIEVNGTLGQVRILKNSDVLNNINILKCIVCQLAFKNKRDLDNHLETVHSGVRTHVCQTCGKGFKKSRILRQHEKIHSRNKLHTCDKCGAGFLNIDHMHRHSCFDAGNQNGIKLNNGYKLDVQSKIFEEKVGATAFNT